MKLSIVAAALATTLFASADASCQTVTTVEGLDIDEFVRASWFIQAQQVLQFQPAENLFCLTATYDLDNPSVPFFGGKTISVNNYGNAGGVNGEPVGGPLCARLPNEDETSKLLVAPCSLPNFLAGDYWVLGLGLRADSSYEWALVSGGQPDRQYEDGCTTREDRATGAGLWLLSRDQILSDASMAAAKEVAASQGVTWSRMIDVPQASCEYSGAQLKTDVFAPSNPIVANSTRLESAAACSKLYKIEQGECGEVCLSPAIAPFAVQFGGVTEGTCADQGYTEYDRTESVSVGPFGNFDTDLYTQPESLKSAQSVSQTVSWSTGSGYASTAVSVGEDVTFVYSSSHDVWQFDDFTAYEACDFGRATQLAGRSDSPFTISAPAGNSYYGCSVGSHCTRGNQKIELVAS